ncbi:MAG TPA: glycosyltransferase 87 family protein, partial [Thermoanaerobaculia bacterium]|nr:glycosyltransferase 87 family protein [Thermoanaerobaculia bacterium]
MEKRRFLLLLLLLTFAVIVVYGSFHFRDAIFGESRQPDLRVYLHAFDTYERGGDPYEDPGFLYTPAFVALGNAAYRALGTERFVVVYRAACLVGAWLLAWISLRLVRWPWPAQLATAVAIVASPLLANGMGCGNVTLLLAGPLALGLVVAERRPWLGGALTGTVNGWKPLGGAAVLLLGVAERGRRPTREQAIFVVASILTSGLWLLVGLRHLGGMLGKAAGRPEQVTQISFQRAFAELGLTVPPVLVFVAVTIAGGVLVWRYARTHGERVAVALACSAIGLPVVNPNTLLLSLPAQLLALDRAAARWRYAEPPRRRRGLVELVVVAAAILGIHGAEGAVATGELAFPWAGLARLVPLLEVVAIA